MHPPPTPTTPAHAGNPAFIPWFAGFMAGAATAGIVMRCAPAGLCRCCWFEHACAHTDTPSAARFLRHCLRGLPTRTPTGYTTPAQVMKLMAITTALAVFGHAPLPNQLVFWAGSGLVSALRLFAFGTCERLGRQPRRGGGEGLWPVVGLVGLSTYGHRGRAAAGPRSGWCTVCVAACIPRSIEGQVSGRPIPPLSLQ